MAPLVDSDPALLELKARDEPIEVPGTGVVFAIVNLIAADQVASRFV